MITKAPCFFSSTYPHLYTPGVHAHVQSAGNCFPLHSVLPKRILCRGEEGRQTLSARVTATLLHIHSNTISISSVDHINYMYSPSAPSRHPSIFPSRFTFFLSSDPTRCRHPKRKLSISLPYVDSTSTILEIVVLFWSRRNCRCLLLITRFQNRSWNAFHQKKHSSLGSTEKELEL
ncbi:hypothetical protein BDP27DRAFT_241626 [Rhodocollybia butyracea]|uniref:Uncharacterized protein n=1 Tax=Rhodocollybia butyracea TaxID=206335 RepID=A0A9P5Q465_9AGAR|nr:hypothetical protein BDP27DRAFT_241626 [Rhodocollybia butyracea]